MMFKRSNFGLDFLFVKIKSFCYPLVQLLTKLAQGLESERDFFGTQRVKEMSFEEEDGMDL